MGKVPKRNMEWALEEIEGYYSGLTPDSSPISQRRYQGGDAPTLRFLGLSAPQIRSFFALKPLPRILTLDVGDALRAWDFIWWQSMTHDVLCAPLFFLTQTTQMRTPFLYWPTAREWAKKVENWVHADAFASWCARCLECDNARVYPTLCRWNRTPSPWLQRLSVVSLLYYSRHRRVVPSFMQIEALVKPLLEHENHYVQKGVGWTLREAGNAYPRETYEFLLRHVVTLPAITFSYATEKVEAKKKERLKEARRRHRSSF